jgi:splicing factor U2AF subunit
MLIGNLPRVLTQEQVVDVLKKFGAMKSFVLQREPDGTSKGLAFFEFLVPASIDTCTQALHNADVSGNRLIVGRATPALVAQATVIAKSFVPPKPVVPFLPMHHMLPSTLPSALPMPMMHPNMMLPLQSMLAASAMAAKSMALPAVQLPVPVNNMPAPALTAPVSASETIASNILVLQNMVDARDLADDEEYADFVADVREECAKFGTVARLDVPRSGCGAGLVWIMYTSIDEATAARKVLEGRKFCGRIIKTYFSTIAALESKEFKPA